MGAWGAGIFQNDVSEDLKSDYVKKLKLGKTDEEALNEIIEDYKDMTDDPDDEIDFWFALSLIMHKYGRLTDFVKDKTLSIIESGSDIERWQDNKTELKRRIKNIEMLKETITSPIPERKKLTIFKKVIAPFNQNEVYYMKLSDDYFKDSEMYNKYLILIIESLVEELIKEKEMIDIYARIYSKLLNKEPKTIEDINESMYIPTSKFPNEKPTYTRILIADSNIGFTRFKNRFTYLGKFDQYERPLDAEEKNSFTFELLPISAFNYHIKHDYQVLIVDRR
jgi:hypothetical protein